MILIGSKALEHYVELNRKTHDWDFIATKDELLAFNNMYRLERVKVTEYSYVYDIKGEIVEIRNPDFLDETDKLLLEINWETKIETPFAIAAKIPSIQFLYDIKRSTASCIDEPKHQYDLNLIEKHYPNLDQNKDFFRKRLAETDKRTSKTKKEMYDFFHKYHIPEYVAHDRLHDIYADLLDLSIPTFKRITVGSTDTSEELFMKLTPDQQVSLMVEEALVLALERWMIPQMIENGINYRLLDHFYNNNEAMPTYKILKHVCITGLKGEATYVTDFSRANFFKIEQAWIKAKEKIKAKGGLPMSFFEELFKLRERYKNGENVVIV